MNCNDTFFGVIIGVMVLELRSAFLRCDLLNCTKHAEGEFGAIKEKRSLSVRKCNQYVYAVNIITKT